MVGNKKPQVWTLKELGKRQKKDMEWVSQVLKIPLGLTAALLRHKNWVRERVQKDWVDYHKKLELCKEFGLPSTDVSGPREKISPCYICFEAIGTRMISAGCSHYYCKECWRRYINRAMRQARSSAYLCGALTRPARGPSPRTSSTW